MKLNSKKWYKLDNAAKIYPAVRRKNWSANFRVSVTLKEKIDPDILQQALDITLKRFPHFNLRLKSGFFWYYMEENPRSVKVEKDQLYPCRPLANAYVNDHLFRVCYYEERIALELFHIVTDGTGAMIFIKTLAAQYLKLVHKIQIPASNGVLDCEEKISNEELEDSFIKYAKFKCLKSRKESRAFHYYGTIQPDYITNIITGQIPIEKLLEQSRHYKVSITEYLVSVIIYTYANFQKYSNSNIELPIKVSVPVNLRNYYPSKTLRNFSLFVNPGIEPKYGEYSFEDIVDEVHHFMRMNLKEKYLNAVMCKNLSDEKNMAIRLTPLFIKNIALRIAYRAYGDDKYTTTLSNVGPVKVPKEMEEYIERFDFILGRSLHNNTVITAISFKETLNITFTRSFKEADVEREFFRFLIKQGIPVKIESNSRG